MSGVTKPLLSNLSVSSLNSFLSREQMKQPPGRTVKIKGTQRLFVGKLEVSASRESLGNVIAKSYLHMNVWGYALRVPSKNMGFLLELPQSRKKLLKTSSIQLRSLILAKKLPSRWHVACTNGIVVCSGGGDGRLGGRSTVFRQSLDMDAFNFLPCLFLDFLDFLQ